MFLFICLFLVSSCQYFMDNPQEAAKLEQEVVEVAEDAYKAIESTKQKK